MLLDGGQISARLTPQAAVATMRQAIADAERGVLTAPARVASDLGQGRRAAWQREQPAGCS